jgi:hypothetical protein
LPSFLPAPENGINSLVSVTGSSFVFRVNLNFPGLNASEAGADTGSGTGTGGGGL